MRKCNKCNAKMVLEAGIPSRDVVSHEDVYECPKCNNQISEMKKMNEFEIIIKGDAGNTAISQAEVCCLEQLIKNGLKSYLGYNVKEFKIKF